MEEEESVSIQYVSDKRKGEFLRKLTSTHKWTYEKFKQILALRASFISHAIEITPPETIELSEEILKHIFSIMQNVMACGTYVLADYLEQSVVNDTEVVGAKLLVSKSIAHAESTKGVLLSWGKAKKRARFQGKGFGILYYPTARVYPKDPLSAELITFPLRDVARFLFDREQLFLFIVFRTDLFIIMKAPDTNRALTHALSEQEIYSLILPQIKSLDKEFSHANVLEHLVVLSRSFHFAVFETTKVILAERVIT